MAINAGADPFSVAAMRTADRGAAAVGGLSHFLSGVHLYLPGGLLGCVVIGAVNGIGSLFYYSGLGLLDASLTQLLNGMYLVFAVLLVRWRRAAWTGARLCASCWRCWRCSF
jgi:drug/metabolite transporter (DMT)-like permease